MSEQGYYQHIRDAVAKKEYEKALALVRAAKAGFTHAQRCFCCAATRLVATAITYPCLLLRMEKCI